MLRWQLIVHRFLNCVFINFIQKVLAGYESRQRYLFDVNKSQP